jgi:beta-lactamase class A
MRFRHRWHEDCLGGPVRRHVKVGCMTTSQLSRRTVLTAAAGVAAAAALGAPRAHAADDTISEIERRHDRTIGVYARNLRTGQTIAHRAAERFAMCSTFKVPAAAAVLAGHLITPEPNALERRLPYPPALVPDELWAPTTRQWLADGYIPTLAEACEAAIRDSDNGAVNLVIQQVGGPSAITDYFRTVGDRVSRLDHWEPGMSVWDPVAHQDTTTAAAMGKTYVNLLLGKALGRRDRARLLGWTESSTVAPPFRSVLPEGWRIADKTGSGDYGSRNDVGIAWTEREVPILVSCFTRAGDQSAVSLDEPLVEVFSHCIESLV